MLRRQDDAHCARPARPRSGGGLLPALSRLGLLLSACCLPAAASAETLADAVALAYQSNPAIQSQRAQLRALNETYVQARAGFGPRVTADVNLTEPLFTGGRGTAALQAAEADVRAGRQRLRQQEIDLLQRVINAYVAVRRDQQIIEVARSTVSVLQNQLEETQAKTEVRENTRTDLGQAQGRLAAAQAQLANTEAQLALSRAQYLNAVGQNPADLAPEPDLPGVPASIEQAFDQAEQGNPTLLAAKFAEQSSRARLSAAKAQNLPSVNLRLAAGRQPSTIYGPVPYNDTLSASAVFSQPLFTAGLNSSQIRRAAELNTADRLTIDSTRRNVVQGLSQQWSQLAAARRALVADEAYVAAAETAFYGMRQEERLGLRTTIELLNTQQELNAAQIGLLRDRYNEYVARAGVLNVMGALTVELLAPGTPSYDPLPDFDRVKNRGALPTEYVVRALDGLVTPAMGAPMPASETAVPDRQADLPPAPAPAAQQPPIRPATQLMDETREGPRAPR
ncbi:MAG: hypothetical protein B7Y99_13415 [Caulobacterales bacterium 32-69-10]|nr:MAG: hypothetical protein B7Y99_13415 [Caulobacterales bacterium 32-69-10]